VSASQMEQSHHERKKDLQQWAGVSSTVDSIDKRSDGIVASSILFVVPPPAHPIEVSEPLTIFRKQQRVDWTIS